MSCAGSSKSTSRNAHQTHACIDLPLEVKVSARSLLQLACWCRQRANVSNVSAEKPVQGGTAWHFSSPPRPAVTPPELAIIVPLEQLWTRLPPMRRQELLGQLTRI